MSAPAVSTTDPSRPDRLHPDDQALAQYSAISRPALLALCLGLASALVLVSPILMVVPLATVVTAIVALRQIASGNGQFTGRWLATTGLCLAMLLLGWGVSRQMTRQAALTREARQVADGWLQLARDGKLQRAFQMTHAPRDRLNSDESIAQFFQDNKEAGEAMQTFFSSEPMKSFLALPKSGTFRFESIAGHLQHGFTDNVTLEYVYGDSSPGAQAQHLWIAVTRDHSDPSATPGWQIGRVEAERPN